MIHRMITPVYDITERVNVTVIQLEDEWSCALTWDRIDYAFVGTFNDALYGATAWCEENSLHPIWNIKLV